MQAQDWPSTISTYLGLKSFMEFMITVINSFCGSRWLPSDPVTIDNSSSQNSTSSVSGQWIVTTFGPSQSQYLLLTTGQDLVPNMPTRPTRQFPHYNCYPCFRGVCQVVRRRRKREEKRFERLRRHAGQSEDDMYDADDEDETFYHPSYATCSHDDGDVFEDGDSKWPSDDPPVAQKMGNCTYYYGYGG